MVSIEKKISLPDYTLGEELINAISHGVGAGFSIAGLVLGIGKALYSGSTLEVVSMALYGSMLFLLYFMSTMYHALKRNNAKRLFRIFDHCTIFLLIAGTYIPIVLVGIGGVVGWIYFGVIVAAAIVGIVFNAIDVEKYEKVSMFCYILMGWVIVFGFKPLMQSIPMEGIKMLVAGGVVYTLGAVLYRMGDNRRYFHSIWHFFVLGGSVFHFFTIYLYVL
jgi:hemolysin III